MDSDVLDCSICLSRFNGKIFLCETGHSFCEQCSGMMKTCPKCSKQMTSNRSFDMENLIEELNRNVKLACRNKGCTYKLTMEDQQDHESDCKYRTHLCHGAIFSKWDCNWLGPYDDIINHYKTKHADSSRLSALTKRLLLHAVFDDYRDTQLLPFLDGKQLFYYKHKVNKAKRMVYWVFQFVGPAREASHYTYEFELNKEHRKFKINGICSSDTVDCEKLMDAQDCVCLTFKQLKHYLSGDGDLEVRFRITTINHVPAPKDKNYVKTQNFIKQVNALKQKHRNN